MPKVCIWIIYVRDFSDKIYDIEVQRSTDGADVHRARFNSSIIDTRMLKESQEFKELQESYVIFITEKDVMGDGFSLYHIDRTGRENGKLFNDGSHITYVNGNYRDDEDPVGKLMHDFGYSRVSDMFYKELVDQVKYYKETERGREIMCKAVDDLAEKRRVDIIADNLKKMVKNLQITLEQGMNTLELSEADRQAVKKRI